MRTILAGLLVTTLALGACAAETPAPGDGLDDGVDDAADFAHDESGKADGTTPALAAGDTYRLQIAHGAYPAVGARPNVIAYIPHGFDPTGPLDVVVFLHGWSNCVDNVVGKVNTRCSAGGPKRQAYNIAGQLEASHKNAILIVPELAFERPTGDPGALANAGAFAALVTDTLAALQPQLPSHPAIGLADLGRIVIASHSGGYISTAAIATRGGLPVDEIYLLDSLYGQTADFDGWVASAAHLPEFVAGSMRLASVYSANGGTLRNNQAMARRAAAWLGVDDRNALLDDRTTATLTLDQLSSPLLFKRSSLIHDDIPRYYVGKLLTSSGLADKPQ